MANVIEIPITQEVIDQAQERSSSHCMIADALKAARPDLRFISVDLQTIRFTAPARRGTPSKRYVYLTPPPAQRALINFDQGIPAEPMTINLRKPAQVLKANTRENAPKNPDGTPRRNARGDFASARQGPKRVVNRRTVVGGHVPPNAVLSNNQGRWREFGLSQLKP